MMMIHIMGELYSVLRVSSDLAGCPHAEIFRNATVIYNSRQDSQTSLDVWAEYCKKNVISFRESRAEEVEDHVVRWP